MSDATADLNLKSKDAKRLQNVLLAAQSSAYYKNTLQMVQADGYVSDCTPTASTYFAGILESGADDPASSGDTERNVWQDGVWLLTFSGTLALSHVGEFAYAEDNQTCKSLTGSPTTNAQKVGIIVEYVDSSHAWVDIAPGVQVPALAT